MGSDAIRLTITLFETEDVLADESLLKAVVGILRDNPGSDEVRMVIRDTAGDETEFDFPRAASSDDLARSLRSLLGTRGQVRLTNPRMAGAA